MTGETMHVHDRGATAAQVGLSMAEIVSSLPTSGGPYFWCVTAHSSARMQAPVMFSSDGNTHVLHRAVHLSPKRGTLPAFAGWMTGEPLQLPALPWGLREGNQECAVPGWFNLLGQVAITAGIDFTVANHVAAMIALSNGHICSQQELLLIYGGEWPAATEDANCLACSLFGVK